MKLASLRNAVHDALQTLSRFPLVLVSAATATVAGIILLDREGPPQPTILWSFLYGGILGIPLLIALRLTGEKRRWRPILSWGIQCAGVVLLVIYASTVPRNVPEAPASAVVCLLLFALAAHMLVAVAPWTGKGEINGFWQYNKNLFLRILVALLFAHVLFGGLAFALAALDNLFGMQIPGNRYEELWVLMSILFTTWFFLAGIPRNLDELEGAREYPKGLRIFTYYILLPIVFVYLAILYAYLAKILISWDWPQGWVSKLILGFAGTGMFSLLLLHPLGHQTENIWIRSLIRWFYVVLIPLVVMLFFAVWRRVTEYGMTEGRYLALALGVWLVLTILYFLLRPAKDIKFIPASLCVGILIVSLGPWGALPVSERSQVVRLESLLKKNALLQDGKVHKSSGNVYGRDTWEVSAILSYLHDMHGYDAIQPWFDQPLRKEAAAPGVGYKDPSDVCSLIGLEFIQVRQISGGDLVFRPNYEGQCDITGYNKMVHSHRFGPGFPLSGRLGGGRYTYRASQNLGSMTVVFWKEGTALDSVTIDVDSTVAGLFRAHEDAGSENVPLDDMSISGTSGAMRMKMFFWEIHAEQKDEGLRLLWYDAFFLFATGD